MNHASATSFALIGKVPSRDDFVHVHAAEPELVELDRFLAGSVEWALARRAGWAAAFAAGGPRAFVFRSAAGGLLAGTLAPSADRAGRQFPVVVALPLSTPAAALAAPHGLPLILEDCWQVAGRLAHDLARGEPPEILESVPVPAIDAAAPLAEALAEYDGWSAGLSLAELWQLIYPGADDGEPRAALRLLVEAVRVCRGLERSDTPLTLRLPLGSAAGAGVCFWIDLVRRLARWGATIPSFFWSYEELLLHLGMPPQSTAAELWLPSRDRDEICDLRPPLDANALRAVPELPAPLGAVLDGQGSAGQLLEAAAALT